MIRPVFRGLTALSLLALWAASPGAHAGTINITGSIDGNTCAVSADSTALLVKFGSVSSQLFTHSGDGGRYEPFTISLEKCGGSASNVTVTFTGNADSSNPELLALTADADAAKGVAIAIYDNNKTLIPLGQPGGSTELTPDQATVTMTFYARYLANGDTVSTGPANSSATFMLNYA
ncbi:fimbrial protein [Scandinavium sp. TWS1a]|uniref:fimbrial protein n=1 Tax=Scandinavium tedordense TaxID=2926521 RepID=UPI00216662E1|nr:fimbrial protein [Scandinavium tedordense]MCS2172979.1 fimbrial protein [Scandinavium tedordense]